MNKIYLKRSILIILLLYTQIFIGESIYAQSKKEQIEIMTIRLDSLNKELQNQKTLNNQLNSTNTQLLLKIDSLNGLNKRLTEQNKSLTLKLDSLNEVIANYTGKIDSLSGLLIVDNNPFERQKEIYQNCVPKDVYNKDECSQLELEYDIVESELLSEENEVIVNKLVQLLLFNHDFNSVSLDYSKIKRDEIKEFINNTDEYYVQSHRYVYCGFISPKLICLDNYLNEYDEGAPRPEIGSQHLIYNLAKKKVMKYNDIFLPNSENHLMQILTNHINQLLSIDGYEGKEALADCLPESKNIDDFGFDFENFLISSQSEKIVSGKLIKADGFGFYFGPLFLGSQQCMITLPFSECAHLLTPEFLALIK